MLSQRPLILNIRFSNFSSFLAVSTTDKPVNRSIHAYALFCVKGAYLSRYSQKNNEGVRAIRAIKYKKYVAGKYARASAPLVRKYTYRIFESKDGTTSKKMVN